MPRCRPGDLCIVIHSNCGNEGREVTVLRWVNAGQWVAEVDGVADGSMWLTEARHPLRNPPGDDSSPLFAGYPDDWLLPLRPGAEPQADVERETDERALEVPLG